MVVANEAGGDREDGGAISTLLSHVGGRVLSARARRGMTRRILARDSGVSERYLAEMESGRGNPSLAVLSRVAAAMNLAVVDLVQAETANDGSLASISRILGQLDPVRLTEARDVIERLVMSQSDARARRISLIGMRGAGKTTLGRRLAEQLGVPFAELNRLIERDYGASIGELLALSGQPAYRRHERAALEAVLNEHEAVVIAPGGGIVAEPETYDALLAQSHAIWLQADPADHMARVIAQGDLRPMADNRQAMEDLKAILLARTADYGRAEARIETSGCSEDDAFADLSRISQGLLGGHQRKEAMS